MKTRSPKSQPQTRRANQERKRPTSDEAAASGVSGFVDSRPEALAQRKLRAIVDQSPQLQRHAQLHAKIDNSLPRTEHETDVMGEESLQMRRSEESALAFPIHLKAPAGFEASTASPLQLAASTAQRINDVIQLNDEGLDDIAANPQQLWGKSDAEVANLLGDGWTRGDYGGGARGKGGIQGWKFTKRDKSVFFHPGGGIHHGSYYGFSSGTLGKNKVVDPDTYQATENDKANVISK